MPLGGRRKIRNPLCRRLQAGGGGAEGRAKGPGRRPGCGATEPMGPPAADPTPGGPAPKDGAADAAADAAAADAAAADAAAAPPRPLEGCEAGRLLQLGFEEAAELVDRDFLEGVRAALGHSLHRACEPGEGLVDYYRKV